MRIEEFSPLIGQEEMKMVLETLEDNWITEGKKTQQLEELDAELVDLDTNLEQGSNDKSKKRELLERKKNGLLQRRTRMKPLLEAILSEVARNDEEPS